MPTYYVGEHSMTAVVARIKESAAIERCRKRQLRGIAVCQDPTHDHYEYWKKEEATS